VFLQLLFISDKKFEYLEPTPYAPITRSANGMRESNARKREENHSIKNYKTILLFSKEL